MPDLSFFVVGHPEPQPRPRACKRGRRVGVYNPTSADEWKARIIRAARASWDGQPFDGPVACELTFGFQRPKSHARMKAPPCWHTSKPDRDNLEKAVLDALTTAGVWGDDAQVAAGSIEKRWSDDLPGVSVCIKCLPLDG